MTEAGPLALFTVVVTLWAFLLTVFSPDEEEPVVFTHDHYIVSEGTLPPPSEETPHFESAVEPDYDPVWDALADCESGNRDRNGDVIEGTARWWYGDPNYQHPSWGLTLFHGGLQFLPATWNWVAPMVLDDPPDYAWQATQVQQVQVAIRTQELQGWEAWPNCSKKIGLLGN